MKKLTYMQFFHECGNCLFRSELPEWQVIREVLREDLIRREKESEPRGTVGVFDDLCEGKYAGYIARDRFMSIRTVYKTRESLTYDGMILAAQLGIISLNKRTIH